MYLEYSHPSYVCTKVLVAEANLHQIDSEISKMHPYSLLN